MRSVIFFAILLSALSPECSARWTRVDSETIRLQGAIDKDSYDSYLAASQGGYSSVILRSEGGSAMPALMIAEDIRRHQSKVRVESHCLSSCANYLLIASPAPQVDCGALVAWHGSPTLDIDSSIQVMMIEDKDPGLIEKYSAWGQRIRKKEREFYEDMGVDQKLLADSLAVMQREGVGGVSSFTFDDMTGDYSETVSAGVWVPTLTIMQRYGIDTRNFCESYDADISSTVKRLKMSAPYTSAAPD